MKLEITFLNQMRMLTDLMVLSFIFIIIFFCLPAHDFKLVIMISIPYFLMFFLPVLILHFNYLRENQNTFFVLESNTMVRKKGIEISRYTSQEMRNIVIYMNGSRGTVNGTLAFSNYYYAKIELLDRSSFVITSLCSNKLDKILKENFEDVEIKTEKVFYPMITHDRL